MDTVEKRVELTMDIEPLLIDGAGQSFSGDDFRMLCRPCVYMFMKDGLPLYIGMSSHGIQRVAQKAHRQAMLSRAECDEVKVHPCISVDAARQLETYLIRRMRPKYNVNVLNKDEAVRQ